MMSDGVALYDKHENRECIIFERDGELRHAHNHSNGWREQRLTLSNLEHHLIMYHKGPNVDELPEQLTKAADE